MKSSAAKRPEHCLMVEELLSTESQELKLHFDYKCFTFNGEIACIQEIKRDPKQTTVVFYDKGWNRIPPLSYNFPEGEPNEPPACLEEILNDAVTISNVFKNFVRLDFYATPKGSVFGEFTPTPATGLYFNGRGSKLLNSYWEKYCPGMI